ncbi:MAG: transcriptional regulator [Pyrinomonadaceae bacterium]|nr:transcriptional regulator [Pyrinomonadaceae bacterium]
MSRPQQQNSYAPATCATCAGTGRQSVSLGYMMSCLVCGGKGHILVTQPSEQCEPCGGSGRRSTAGRCLSCAGTGWSRGSSQR